MPSTNKVLRVRNLHITYGEGSHKKTAVKNVTFDVKKGEILGLVGESGSGKTTIGKAIAQIIPIAGGNVYFNNKLIFGPPPLINKNFKKIINDLRYLKHDCFMLKKILEKISQNEKNITVHSVKNLRIMVEKSIINVEGLWDYLTAFKSYFDEARYINSTLITKYMRVFIYTIKSLEKAIENTFNMKTDLLFINHILNESSFSKQGIKTHLKTFIELKKSKDVNTTLVEKDKQAIKDQKSIINVYKTCNAQIFDKYENIYNLLIQNIYAMKLLGPLVCRDEDFNEILNELISLIPNYQPELQTKLNTIVLKIKSIRQTEQLYDISLKEVITQIPDIDLPKKSTWYAEKKDIQMIFQDPTSSLNGHMTVRDIIAEGLKNYPHIYNTKENKIHAQIYFNKKQDEDFKKLEEYQRHIKTYIETSSVHYKENLEKYNKLKHKYDHEKFDDKYLLDYTITQIIKKVGLLPEHLNRYPHEFSGGQKQRIGIARAIALKPSLIIADEPISALDMSIRSQILNLFNTFKKELGFGCIFITHDLNAVKYIADRIAVIYHGIIVEVGTTEEIFNTPVHPYTKHLLAAIPKISNQGIGSSYIDDNIKYEYDKIHYDYHVNPPQYHTLENEHTVYLNQREIENYNNYIKSIINTKAKPKTSFTKKAIGEII